jgi:hypothetical protein
MLRSWGASFRYVVGEITETLIIDSPHMMEGALMSNPELQLTGTGLEVLNLRDNATFADRRLHTRDVALQAEGMERLARAFVERPDTILQELVNAAVELCGADSAGISIEKKADPTQSFITGSRRPVSTLAS